MIDMSALEAFYNRDTGKLARRLIIRHIRSRWNNLHGLTVIGIGHTAPYLATLKREASTTLSLSPAAMGARCWPHRGASLTALFDPLQLPFADESIDRILLVHALEHAAEPSLLLAEAARVLRARGRLLLIVPNRYSWQSRFGTTPFGSGQPYSRRQSHKLLRDADLLPCHDSGALFMPPRRHIHNRTVRWAVGWERMGLRLWPGFAGVLVIEGEKEIYAMIPNKLVHRVHRSRFAQLKPAPA